MSTRQVHHESRLTFLIVWPAARFVLNFQQCNAVQRRYGLCDSFITLTRLLKVRRRRLQSMLFGASRIINFIAEIQIHHTCSMTGS